MSHALQPLDVAIFKSLKDHFSKSIHALSFARKNFVISERDFARVFKDPFEHEISMTNIKAGFRKSGIYPLDPSVVPVAKKALHLVSVTLILLFK